MQSIGKYQILRLLGQGGMGAVYEAVDEKIKSRVALKILKAECAQNVQLVLRFINEAQIANSIAHPGIVKVFDHGFLPSGEAFLAMELVGGETLRRRIAHGCSEADVIRWGRQIASALATAHETGIVHRDLKPDNLMLVRDPDVPGGERIKVLDFGIARITRPEEFWDPSQLTVTGMLMGTPSYMAPEQCSNAKSIDAKADVYALGVILYEALSGKPPFFAASPADDKSAAPGASTVEILFHHLRSLPPPLAARCPGVSAELAELVHRLLSKSPGERPDMRALGMHLEALSAGASRSRLTAPAQSGAPALTPLSGERQAPASFDRRKYARMLLGAVALVLCVAAQAYLPRRPATDLLLRQLLRHLVDLGPEASAVAPSLERQERPQAAVARGANEVPHREARSGSGLDPRRPGVPSPAPSGASGARSANRMHVQTASAPRLQHVGTDRSSTSPYLLHGRPHLHAAVFEERLLAASAEFNQGNYDRSLQLLKNLLADTRSLPIGTVQRFWFHLGRSACMARNLDEANRAYGSLSPSHERSTIEELCKKNVELCRSGDRRELCLRLRQLTREEKVEIPRTIRDPWAPGL